MRRLLLLAPLAILFLAQPACDEGCTDIAIASINLVVTNADTGARLCNATVTANDGTRTETIYLDDMDCTYRAFERSGTFTITIEQTGYETETLTDVVVKDGKCHPVPIDLSATLTPIPLP